MEFVLDANILVSALIKDGFTRNFLTRKEHDFYAPTWILEEIIEHLDEISQKAGVGKKELKEILEILLVGILVVEAHELREFCKEAKRISPDKDDWQYFAVALKLGISIWSNDSALKKQGRVRVFSTKEIGDGKFLA